MQKVIEGVKTAAARYNGRLDHLADCKDSIISALTLLSSKSKYQPFGYFENEKRIHYYVFSEESEISRPVHPDLFIEDIYTFSSLFDQLICDLKKPKDLWSDREVNLATNVIYTGTMAVACCYDLWQKGSRKTPGTFFEVLMAALFKEALPNESFHKHIPLTAILGDIEALEDDSVAQDKESASSVSTDLVICSSDQQRNLVIPLKITTRERIVQPFAHQRILDSVFGKGKYESLLVCISETQQDKKKGQVKHICVPGTVTLFQKHLASLSGLYYCDIPPRYSTLAMQKIIPVRPVGQIFIDAARFFGYLQ